MKRIALAAAALMIGAPAFAQTTTTTQDQSMSDQTMTTSGQTPMGGYQPDAPPLSAQPEPGQKVIFVPSKSPSEAFPPPAPKADYPVCKQGQTDGCRQRGG